VGTHRCRGLRLKLKRIRITPELLVALLRGNYRHFTTEPRLPRDLKIVDITRTFYPYPSNTFDLIVESEEFEELKEAETIPDIELICRDIPTVDVWAIDPDTEKKIKVVIEGATVY